MKKNNTSPIIHDYDENFEVSEVHADADDDNDDEKEEEEIDGTTTETETIQRRDEVHEVRKMSSKDTKRLHFWRIVVTSVILLTAFAVTFTTYRLLKQQEDENFKTAVCCLVLIPYICYRSYTCVLVSRVISPMHHHF